MNSDINVIVSTIGVDDHSTCGEIVSMVMRAAMQEDVDAIGIISHASTARWSRNRCNCLSSVAWTTCR